MQTVQTTLQKIKVYLSSHENRVNLVKTLGFYISIYAVFLFLADRMNVTTETVQAYFGNSGPFLVPLFIGSQLLASLTPLPDTPFNAAAILFFNPVAAFSIIITGMWIGTIVNFFIARRLGQEFVHRRYPQTSEWIDKIAGKYWFETIATGRSFMLVTFDLMAYAAGISTISLKKFAFASIIGLIPVALNSLLLGMALTAGNFWKTVVYGLSTAALAVLIGVVGRFLRVRWENHEVKHA
jgi:uncharacterized membrane protein YdjX (TVP38/TMEM64 family)